MLIVATVTIVKTFNNAKKHKNNLNQKNQDVKKVNPERNRKGKKGLQLFSPEVWMKIIKALQNTSRVGAI